MAMQSLLHLVVNWGVFTINLHRLAGRPYNSVSTAVLHCEWCAFSLQWNKH